jgi:glycosyltransferase involved in cell wall biosynthesis
VVEDGVSGYTVSDQASAVSAVKQIDKIDRKKVRKHFENNFTADRMALDYLKIYERMVGRKKAPLTTSSGVLNWMKLPSPSSSTT